MKVSILTASLPERGAMLAEAKASVLAQVSPGVEVEHLIATDHDGEGAGPLLNRCLSVATGDWVMVLDDDDLLDPWHVATVAACAEAGCGDVIYSMPTVTGGSFTQYHAPFDPSRMESGHNMVSHNALMDVGKVRAVGGWEPVRAFDLNLFVRLWQAGAEFHRIPKTTWTYRLHGSNWSQGTLTR